MPKVTFIYGPCGAGKSHVATEVGGEVLDEHESFTVPEGASLSPAKYDRLRELLAGGNDCAVVEACLFHEGARQAVTQHIADIPNVEVAWIGFELDREAANHNCLHRTNKGDGPGHVRINNSIQDDQYTFPEGAERRAIYRLPTDETGAL